MKRMNGKNNFFVLQKLLNQFAGISGTAIFVVGGALRDILLKIQDTPKDIDITGNFSHVLHRSNFEDIKGKEAIKGFFSTEKYGTSTLILENTEQTYTVEFTPFREESGYDDHRHPTDVQRTSSLLADAARRDFTVNAMYYTYCRNNVLEKYNEEKKSYTSRTIEDLGNDKKGYTFLQNNGWYYIQKSNVFLLQSPDIIQRCVENKSSLEIFQTLCSLAGIEQSNLEGFSLLIDPYLGINDILNGKLRAVGTPEKRFYEDALRILRGVRFVNTFNQFGCKFDFESQTRQAMKKLYYIIPRIAKERIRAEIVKVFMQKNPFGYIALLDDLNLLQYIFPALSKTKGPKQPMRYHPFDTYSHTLLTLWHLQLISSDYLVKLAMLYHDVGKTDQYYYYQQCRTKEDFDAMHKSRANHVHCGPDYVKKDFSALGFSHKEIEEIAWYVANHMRPGQLLQSSPETMRKKLRLLYAENGYERVYNLLSICRADRLGQYNPVQTSEIDDVQRLYDLLDELKNTEGQFTKSLLDVNGNDIMKEFFLAPGKIIGDCLEKAFHRVSNDIEKRNKKETILHYIAGLLK